MSELYQAWAKTGGSFSEIAKAHKTTAAKVADAVQEGLHAYRVNSAAPLSVADPFSLFGGRFSITPFNPDQLVTRKGLGVFDQMREDDQIKAALAFKKHTVLAAGWEIVSPEGMPDDWEPTVFLENMLIKMDGSFQTSLIQIMTALDYGYSVTEKIFGEVDGKIAITSLETRKPAFFEFRADQYGKLMPDGLWQRSAQGGFDHLPIDKFVLYAYQYEFNNHYGTSDLVAAYRPWWSKDNAYKFMLMVLERYGVPTILAMYDSKKYDGAQVDKLYTALQGMSSTTMGVIPRDNKDALELWSPDNMAKNATDVFGPVMDMFNRDIARALLMPGLMGLSPDQAAGSFARARVQFDVFMLLVEYLRNEIAEKVMMDQIIKPIIDLNFAVDEYPEFRFKPLTDDVRLDILDAWAAQIGAGTVKSTPNDENRVRELLDFEQLGEDELLARKGEPVADEPVADDEPEAQSEFAIHIDYASIERDLDKMEAKAAEDIAGTILVARNRFLKHIEANFKLDSAFPATLKTLRGRPKITEAVTNFLLAAYTLGRSTMRREVRAFTNGDVTWGEYSDPNFVPADAVKHLKEKAFWITGIIENDLLDESKGVLIHAVTVGQPMRQTITRLEEAFNPFIGDPQVISDGKVVSRFRLETIVRTNATDAFNNGRLVQARQAGELLQGFEYSATLDARTTDVCNYLHGKKFRPNDGTADNLSPPRHFNCRSILLPIPAQERVDPGSYIKPKEVVRATALSGKGFK